MTNMENNLHESSQSTENNSTNKSAVNIERPLKRTSDAVVQTETTRDLSNNRNANIPTNNGLDHNIAGESPTKKAKFISSLQSKSKSSACSNVSSKALSRKIDRTLEKTDDKSSTSNSNKLVNNSSESKSTICGIFNFYSSTNRLDIDEKPITKNEKKFKANISTTTIKEERANQKNSVEEFKFLLHAIKLKIEDNHQLTALLNVNDVSTALNEIYCLQKQIDNKKHYSLIEVKLLHEQSTICYKKLFSPEFDLRRYFKTFLYLKESVVNDEIDEIKIYCNRDLNRGSLQKGNVGIISPDGNSCKFKVKKNHEIYDKFIDCCVLPNLAKKILECIKDNKTVTKKFKMVMKYHAALIKEKVLKLTDETRDGTIPKTAKFHQKFIENHAELSEPAKELRKHIINNLPNGCDCISPKMFFKVTDSFGVDDGNSILTLPRENYDELFETFFKVFQFEIIDDKFDSTTKDIIGDEFMKMKDQQDLKLLRKELLLHLEEKPNTDLFQTLNNKMSNYTLKNKLKSIKHPKVDVEFEEKIFDEFEKCLRNFKSQCTILYSSDYLHLSTLKIQQFMSRISENGEESLDICSNTFLERTVDVMSVLESNATQALVIRLDGNPNETSMKAALTKLEHSITEGKYVIVVSNTETREKLDSNFKQISFENQLFDLKLESQNKVMNFANVYLHGRPLRIMDIADDKAAAELMKDPQVLEDILYRKLIIGRDLVKPDGFKEKFFEIRMTRYVVIDEVIFHETTNDIFAICNIDYNDFLQYIPRTREHQLCNSFDMKPNAKYILMRDQNGQQLKLQTLSERHSGYSVHRINFECGEFVWKETIGSIDILIKHKIAGVNNSGNESYDASNDESKTIIISGRSGMGKSVCLYDLAGCLLTSNDPVWIIQLNLNESLLKQFRADENFNYKKFLAATADTSDKKIFNMAIDGQLKMKIVMFIDGYDELRQESSISLLFKLLKELQTSPVHKIYVASRSKFTRRLETALGVFSYSLKFSHGEKEQFLKEHRNIVPADFLKNYARLTNSPLNLKMAIDLCRDSKVLESLTDVHALYREYVKLKLDRTEYESAGAFSVRNLLASQGLKLSDCHVDTTYELPEELRHETFKEYFAARWLFCKSYRCPEDKSKAFKCVKRLEERASPVFINTYLSSFSLDSLSDDLFEAVEDGNLKEIERLAKDDRLMNVRDQTGKCVLHRANDEKTLELLIGRKHVDVNATDYARRTPLHSAVDKNLPKCAILLLKAGAAYDLKDQLGSRPCRGKSDENPSARMMLKMIDKLFKDICSSEPKIFVSKNPEALANYLSKAEKMYGITPDVIVNVRDRKNNTLLHYAKKINYLAVAESLRKYGAEDERKIASVEEAKLQPEADEASAIESWNALLERFEESRDLEVVWENDDPNSMSDDSIRRFREIFDHRHISVEQVEANVSPANSWLDDGSMDAFLRVLQSSHPDVVAQSTLYQYMPADRAIEAIASPSIQIIGGNCINHWRCLYFDGTSIRVYDSNCSPDSKLSRKEDRYVRLRYPSVRNDIVFEKLLTRQPDGDSCGLYAAAFAETLSSDGDPASVKYSLDVRDMRHHFMRIIKEKRTMPFPRLGKRG